MPNALLVRSALPTYVSERSLRALTTVSAVAGGVWSTTTRRLLGPYPKRPGARPVARALGSGPNGWSVATPPVASAEVSHAWSSVGVRPSKAVKSIAYVPSGTPVTALAGKGPGRRGL